MISTVLMISLIYKVISQPCHRNTRETLAVTGSDLTLYPASHLQFIDGQWAGPFSPHQVKSNSYYLDISSITERNTGQYIFNGTLPSGDCYWDEVFVYVGAQDSSRIYGKSFGAEIGESVLLFCGSGGDTKWFFKGEELPFNVYNTLDKYILIKSFSIFNVGIYTCYGKWNRTPDSPHFVTSFPLILYDLTKISQPFVELLIGQQTTLMCPSNGMNLWTFKYQELPYNAALSTDGSILHLFNVAPEHNNGYYECTSFDSEGSLNFVTRALVTVHEKKYRSETGDRDSDNLISKLREIDFNYSSNSNKPRRSRSSDEVDDDINFVSKRQKMNF